MDELSDYSSPVMEFEPTTTVNVNQAKLTDTCVGTDPMPSYHNISIETNRQCPVSTQTEQPAATQAKVEDRKLAVWLQKIAPLVEAELLKGPTPLVDNFGAGLEGTADDINIQTYQKISMGTTESSQGLATWLSVHTSNAPVLVLSATPTPHDDWCEHVNQQMKIYVPKRLNTANFVVYTEMKSIPLKACLRTLCTNSHNKNIFAGSTLDGDIYVWQYEHNSNANGSQIEIRELHNITATHGFAVAMDWNAENRLLSCHANGNVVQWLVGKEMLKEWEYELKPTPNANCELTTLICLGLADFVVGTKDGSVYQCWHSTSSNAVKKPVELRPLRKHLFMVSTLLKGQIAGQSVLISCDLSGQVYYHDVKNNDDDTAANVIVQIPLPFKNAIACSPRDADMIYCPGNDGALECYRIRDGVHTIIKGALRGRGNFIKCSDNGCWMITGLYEDDFQIFYME